MAKYKITGPDGKTYEVNAPDGASEQDVLAYAQRSFGAAPAPAARSTKPFGEDLGDALADLLAVDDARDALRCHGSSGTKAIVQATFHVQPCKADCSPAVKAMAPRASASRARPASRRSSTSARANMRYAPVRAFPKGTSLAR